MNNMPRLFCARFGVKQQRDLSGLAAKEGDDEVSNYVFTEKRARKNRLSRSIKVLKCLSPMAALREARLGSTNTFTDEDSVDKINHHKNNESTKASRYRRIRAWGSSKTESDAMKDYLESQGMDCEMEDLFAARSRSQLSDPIGNDSDTKGRHWQDDVASQLTDERSIAPEDHFQSHCMSISGIDELSLSQKSRTVDPGEDQPTVSSRSLSHHPPADPPAVSRSDASYYEDEMSSGSDESYHKLSRAAAEDNQDEEEEDLSRVGILPFRFHLPKVVPLRCEDQPERPPRPMSPSGKSVDDQSSRVPSVTYSTKSPDDQKSQASHSPLQALSPKKLPLETLPEDSESPAILSKPDPPAAKDSDSNYSGFTSKLEEKLQQHQGPEISVHSCDRTAVSEITNDTCFTEPMIRSLPNPLTTSTTRVVRDAFSGRPVNFRDSSLAGHASMIARRNKNVLFGNQQERVEQMEVSKKHSSECLSTGEEKRDFGMKDLISKFERLAKPTKSFGRSPMISRSNSNKAAGEEPHESSVVAATPIVSSSSRLETATPEAKSDKGFFWRSYPAASPHDTSDTCPEEESDLEQSLDHSQELEPTYVQYNLTSEDGDMAEV